jgi:hypothetical protein
MKKIVRLTESDLVRLVKRVINEQDLYSMPTSSIYEPGSGVLTSQALKEKKQKDGWIKVRDGLKSYYNPNVISSRGVESLNWGTHKSGGYDWGLSIDNHNTLPFQTKSKNKSQHFEKVVRSFGLDPKIRVSDNWFSDIELDYSNPQKIIDMVKKILDGLFGK